MKVIKWLKHLSYKKHLTYRERLRDLGMLRGIPEASENSGEILSLFINTWWEGAKTLLNFHWQKERQWAETETPENISRHSKIPFYCKDVQTAEQVGQGSCRVPVLKPSWTWSWITCFGPAWAWRGLSPADLSNLNCSVLLCFHKYVVPF